MRVWGLTVLVVLLCSGSRVLGQDIFEREAGLYSTVAISDTLEIGSADRISIRSVKSLRGSVSISVAEQDFVLVTYYKQARAGRKSDAVGYPDRWKR